MLVLEVCFLVLFWAWVFSAALLLRNTILPRLPLDQPADFMHLSAEPVRFRATDGLQLEGWKIVTEPAQPWIIFCHGVGSNRADLLPMAAALHEAGFNVLLFDFRGHGTSRGRTTSFGWVEQRDLEGALAFLGQQPDVPARPYGVYGISMGAAVALMVASRDERIGAVAADSPYANLEEAFKQHLTLLYPWAPKIPFLWFVLATYRIRFGVWPRQVSPQASAALLSPRPLLLIQGGRDPRMPIDGAQAILASAGPPKDLLVIEEASHLEGFALDPQRYLSRLVQFFQSSWR